MAEQSTRGGARPGAGRKPGQRAARPKEARQVTLRPELWQELDAAQAEQCLSRAAMFELMARLWLDSLQEGGGE